MGRTFISAASTRRAYQLSNHQIPAAMLDRSLHLSHIQYAHHTLPAFNIRSFPSPSLQRLPYSPSSYVRIEASKTADFIKLQVAALISQSLPPLVHPLVYFLAYLLPSFLMTEANIFKCSQALSKSPHTHTHTQTTAPLYRERVGVLGFSVQGLCHCEVSSDPRGRHREHVGVQVQGQLQLRISGLQSNTDDSHVLIFGGSCPDLSLHIYN